ncbi:MAG: MotA/TolQ/ExbB proton channel family protein [Phycisphaerales bacterium]
MRRSVPVLALAMVLSLCATVSAEVFTLAAEVTDGNPDAPAQRSLLDLVQAGGPVGYAIILLSLCGLALVVDSYLRLKDEKLVPQNLAQQVHELTTKGRFEEVLSLCKTHDSMLARVIAGGLSDGKLGIDAVREGLEQQGVMEVTRLRERIGYIGLIASVAPMLGLLGTVTGMIASFRLLGEAQGAARPDELALGISQALVTTCMGLVVAVPLMFFYAFFRNRITRIGNEAAAVGEKMLRIMSVVLETRRQNMQQAANPVTGVKS